MPRRSATVWLALASIAAFSFSFEKYSVASLVQHRHVAVFEGDVAAVVLFDGDVLQTTSDQKPAATCVVTSHGDARLAAVDISSHQSARASWLTWLVRLNPCRLREPLAYMHHDSCARVSVLAMPVLCCSACLSVCKC